MLLNLLISTTFLIVLLIYGHKLSRRGSDDLLAVQSAHHRATVRFGGAAIVCGITTVIFTKPLSDISILIFLSGLPIFFAGLLEDITGKVSPKYRLLAAFGSAGSAVLLTGVYIHAGDFWILDKLFIFSFVAIPVTILISSGVANSFNIIDGINGFSSGLALIIALVLGYVCRLYGEINLSYFCYMIAIAIIPFLIANFPFGFIFLGDAGAYTLGHLLTWVGIILMHKHPDISAWAMLLLFFWPATEILLSIYRRFVSNKSSAAPDSFHFHHLIMQFLRLKFGESNNIGNWANPLSTLILIPFATIPIISSLFVLQNNILAIVIYSALAVTYLGLYIFLVRNVKLLALDLGYHDMVDSLNSIFTPKKM